MVLSNIHNGEIFTSGDDKTLKKYDYPNEQFAKIDFKKAPGSPAEEFKSHDLPLTSWDFSNEIKFMVTGGRDGNFVLRNMNHVAQSNEIKGHSVFNGGINALCFSRVRSTLYTAGGDGAFLAWTVGGKANPSQPVQSPKGELEAIDKIDTIEDMPDKEIKSFKEILLDEFYTA